MPWHDANILFRQRHGMVWVMLGAGLVLLVVGGEFLVRGASRLAANLGVPPLLVGLTVVAMGTSAPELAVGIGAAFAGRADIVIGNVVGSNILNVLLILGMSAVIVPLTVARTLIRLDVPLMIGASILTLLLSLNGVFSRVEGTILLLGFIGYNAFQIVQARREIKLADDEFERHYGRRPEQKPRIGMQIALIVAGLLLLVQGADWLVESSVAIAQRMGVSELVIGLTVVAIGTSLPEIATSLIAALRGERDIAVGNIVGSCLFNLLCVLGLTAMVSPQPILVSDAALYFDVPVMTAVAIACLPIFATGHQISRWEGSVFLVYYFAYTAYLLLDAAAHDALPMFSAMMLRFVLPITILALSVVAWRNWQARRGARA